MVNQIKKLQLFSASKDQLEYFTQLKKHIDLPVECTHYKNVVGFSLFVRVPNEQLKKQVEILLQRKANSASGKSKPSWFWKVFRLVNQINANLLYRKYFGWLQRLDADFVGVWNGKKFRQAILVLAAKAQNKQIIYFETGPLPGYSVIDPVGVDYYSAIPRSADFYLARPLKSSVFNLKEDFPRPQNLPEHYIFVPFQVVEDSNIYLHSPWIKDMRHLYKALEIAAEENPAIHFVVKPHPACPERYDDLMKSNHPQIQFVKEHASQVLVQHADAVLTINSTVGMEAIMARKKVLVLGQAIYGFAPLSQPVENQAELEKVLKNITNWKVEERLIEHYLDYLATDYAIEGDAMKSPTKAHWEQAQEKMRMMLSGKLMQAIGLER